MNARELAERASDIFVLPDAVTRLKECMDDSAASMDDIAEIIAFDPGLTSQLLKVANSALYRFPNKIETISKAIQVIGTRSVYDLSLAYGISNTFSDVETQIIDLDKFWEQSVSCALLAKYFAEQKRLREPERLFVSGLLHNIGELVVLSVSAKAAKRCMAFNTRVTPAQLQRAVLGFTYVELSACMLESWGIPSTIFAPVSQIHTGNLSEHNMDAQILQLAYVLALDNVHPDVYPSYNNLSKDMHDRLNFKKEDLEDALDITNLQCISVISLFNPSAYMLY